MSNYLFSLLGLWLCVWLLLNNLAQANYGMAALNIVGAFCFVTSVALRRR